MKRLATDHEIGLRAWVVTPGPMRSHSEPGTFLRPVRVTITIPYNAYQALVERSNAQGRSLSNLAAYLLESGLQTAHPREHTESRPELADAFRRRA